MSWPQIQRPLGSVFDHFDGAEDEGCGDVGPGRSKGDWNVGLSSIYHGETHGNPAIVNIPVYRG